MQRISVNLTNDCDGNQLTTETFRNRFFDSNRQRKTPTVIHHLLSSPSTLWPKAPDIAL